MAVLLALAFWSTGGLAKALAGLLPPGVPMRWALPRALLTFAVVQWVWWQIALTLTAPNTAWHALLLSCGLEAVVEVRHWLRLRRLRRKLTPEEFQQLLMTQMRMRP